MKKKGFTLVELLAVIIILAVIAIIAIPIVLNVVESSRKSAFESSVYGVIETIGLEVADKMIKGESLISEYNFPTEELEFQGEQPTGGIAKTDRKGKVSIAVHNGKWCAIKGYDEGTLTVIEYEERTCILKEAEVYYYGYIDNVDYKVDLNGVIVEYTGSDTEIEIPENFSGKAYYYAMDEEACINEFSKNFPEEDSEELRVRCYLTFLNSQIYIEILKGSDVISQKFGYIEYHNVEIDYDRCDTIIDIYNEQKTDTFNSKIYNCSLNDFIAAGFTMEQMYQLEIITADRYVVDKYGIEELNGTETFEYVLDKEKCISLFNPEGTLSNEATLTICHAEILDSDEETINGYIEEGLITEANGYYKFSNLSFNKEKCVSVLTEIGLPSSETSAVCSYDTLIDEGASINMMYEAGIVTAEREVGYFEEDVVVEQHHYEMDYDVCKNLLKQGDASLTDDEALMECISSDAEIQAMDISGERGEALEEFNQLTQFGILNKVSTVFAIKNVEIDETECKKFRISSGDTEEEANNNCTESEIFSSEVPYKFLYEQGIITGEVMDINYPIKENDINKTVNTTGIGHMVFSNEGVTSIVFPSTIETIGTAAFMTCVISGELDLSNTKITTIADNAFYNNGITSIKLPSSVEIIGEKVFEFNDISGELDLSNTKITTIGVYAFAHNDITSVKFPSSVKTIGGSAFSNNFISGELDLSNTKITTIGEYAFYKNQISLIKLPVSVETIGDRAFYKFSDLNSNPNLALIVNPSGRSFDWSDITYSTTPNQNFVTGTIVHENGNIEVKAE